MITVFYEEPYNPFPDVNPLTKSRFTKFVETMNNIVSKHQQHENVGSYFMRLNHKITDSATNEILKLENPVTKEPIDFYRSLVLYEYYHYLNYGYFIRCDYS